MKKQYLLACATVLTFSALNGAELLNDNFESGISGFTLVDNSGQTPTPALSTVGGNGGGSALHIGDNLAAGGTNTLAAGWAQANGVLADVTQDFTLTFDFKFEQEGTFDDANIFIGALDDKDYYRIGLGENVGSAQLYLIEDGTRRGATASTYTTNLADDTWYSASISWTAATDTLAFDANSGGSAFSVVLNGADGADTESFKSIAASGVQFGFGTFNDRASFDNVVINGVAIPEPSAYALIGGLIALGSVVTRRRV